MRTPLLTVALASAALLALAPVPALAQTCTSSCSPSASNRCPNTQSCVCTVSPRWQSTSPLNWTLYHHASGIDGVPFATLEAEVKGAFDTWGTQSCSRLRFNYGGTFVSSTPNAAINANDGKNQLVWIDSGWPYGSGTLGVTHAIWTVGSNSLHDADIEFNNAQKTWSTHGTGGTIDLQSIATHEGGHFWGANHTPGSASVMYFSYTSGKKRTPSSDDVGQLCCLYPSTAQAGSLGDFCQTASSCKSPLICAKPTAGGHFICTESCNPGGAACPAGYGCGAAIATPVGTSNGCFLLPTAPSDLCSFCDNGQTCSSGLCLFSPPYSFCSSSCTSDAQCGAGFQCVAVSGGGEACAPVPTGQVRSCPPVKPQCGPGKSCPTYFHCESATGMCVGGGQDESCAVQNCVSSSTVCLSEEDGPICRKYCMTRADCPAGQDCYGLRGSSQRVCSLAQGGGPDAGTPPGPDAGGLPGSDAGPASGPCQTCTATQGCAAGFTCLFMSAGATTGACHRNCAKHGDCPSDSACIFSKGGGSPPEWCACPGQLAQRDQPCGSATGKSCGQVDMCVAASGSQDFRCRQRCTTNAECSGGRCASVRGGGGVCLPSDADGGVSLRPDASALGADAAGPGLDAQSLASDASATLPDAASQGSSDGGGQAQRDGSAGAADSGQGPTDAGTGGGGAPGPYVSCGCGSGSGAVASLATAMAAAPLLRRRRRARRVDP